MHQLELVGLHGVPIIMLISLLVWCIVAQQGVFQLRSFGTDAFVVERVGILSLRELRILLTAIMVAGRSMKMREEIYALTVIGLDPIEVLIVPRLLALIVAMLLLTFLADMAAIIGMVASMEGLSVRERAEKLIDVREWQGKVLAWCPHGRSHR